MNPAILGLSSVIVHGSMIGSHRWKKTVEKWPISLALASVKSPNPSQWNIEIVKYSRSHAAGYPKIGW